LHGDSGQLFQQLPAQWRVERLRLPNQPDAIADRCHGHREGTDDSRCLVATIRPRSPFRPGPALEPGRPPGDPPALCLNRLRDVAPSPPPAIAGASLDRPAPTRHTSLARFHHRAASLLSVHG
jgi:hypothetical protein